MVGSGYERGLLPKSPLLPWYQRWKNKVRLVDSCVSGHVQSKETKTQRNKETRIQRNKETKKQRNKDTKTCPTTVVGLNSDEYHQQVP